MTCIEQTSNSARCSAESAQAEPPSGRQKPRRMRFCTYLAKQFIAEKGFEVARVPEVAGLYQFCDVVLTRSDGYSFGILCIVDREARPDATFGMSMEELEAIGQSCLEYSGRMNGRKMPVAIQVVEVGPKSPDQAQRLQAFKRTRLFAKVVPSAMIVDPISREVWSSGDTWFSKDPHLNFVKKIVATLA